MTLNKSIEAAREALEYAVSTPSKGYDDGESLFLSLQDVKKALSTLPANPMAEEEALLTISPFHSGNLDEAILIIRALHAAGVLYVEEGK